MHLLNAILNIISQPLKKNWRFLLFMYTLGIITSYSTIPKDGELYKYAWSELFFDLFSVTILLTIVSLLAECLLGNKKSGWSKAVRYCCSHLSFVVYVVAYPLAIIDVFCFVKFSATINPTMLLLVMETNSDEAGEFLSSFLTADVFASSISWIVLLMLVHILLSIKRVQALVYRIFKPLRRCFNAYVCRIAESLLGVVAIVLFVFCVEDSWKNKQNIFRLLSLSTIGEVEKDFNRPDKAQLYQPFYRALYSIQANNLTNKQIDILRETVKRATVDSCEYKVPEIVLIIGESYNKHHSQLFGYNKKTTPNQMRRKRRGELVAYTDVVAPWNLTSFCFKHMMTFYCVGDKGDWCDYSLFPVVFRKAGYNVVFMTNQFLNTEKDAVYDFSGGFFLNDPELSAAQFDVRNRLTYRYDAGLLHEYDTIQNKEKANNLTIFHLKGQHMAYKQRYPANRRKWKKEDYEHLELKNKERDIMSHYDNAVLYNDSIVNSILKRFEKKDAVVLYVPDHGEEMYGGDVRKMGRVHDELITKGIAEEEYELPVWIWSSRKFRASHAALWSQIKSSRHKPMMTDQLPHILVYLAGIHTKEYRAQRNPLEKTYDAKRERILKHTTSYETLKSGK